MAFPFSFAQFDPWLAALGFGDCPPSATNLAEKDLTSLVES